MIYRYFDKFFNLKYYVRFYVDEVVSMKEKPDWCIIAELANSDDSDIIGDADSYDDAVAILDEIMIRLATGDGSADFHKVQRELNEKSNPFT